MFCLKMIRLLCIFLFLITANSQNCDNSKEVVCYWGSWSIYRPSIGQFHTEYMNPTLCTAFIYTFSGLDIDLKMVSLDNTADIALSGYQNMTKLKEINPCLKTSIAIGGWNAGSMPFSIIASVESYRQNFADSVIKFLIYYGFDGLDLDWEYPTSRGGLIEDKENFVLLLRAIKEKFEPWGFRLTIAVPIDDALVTAAYDVVSIANIVDYVHLMAYDYTSATSNVTGLNSPISIMKTSIEYWLNEGLPPNKLILGIPAYARAFILDSENNSGIGAPTSTKYIIYGPYTQETGFMAYYELLRATFRNSKCTENKSDGNKWTVCEDEWYSYDDEETIQEKVNYALQKDLGGVMMWSIDTDDFRGDYGHVYPLLTKINSALGRNAEKSTLMIPKLIVYPKMN